MSSVEFIGIHKINRKKAPVKATKKKKKNENGDNNNNNYKKKKNHGLIKYED